MQIEAFIQSIGGRSAVIAETGLTKGRVSQWVIEGRITPHWVKYFSVKYPEQCREHGITPNVDTATTA